jgi:hypothetical protein
MVLIHFVFESSFNDIDIVANEGLPLAKTLQGHDGLDIITWP